MSHAHEAMKANSNCGYEPLFRTLQETVETTKQNKKQQDVSGTINIHYRYVFIGGLTK